MPLGEPKCFKTTGCMSPYGHLGPCFPIGPYVQNVNMVDPSGKIYQLEKELNELRTLFEEMTARLSGEVAKERASHLWNEETKSYQIPLSTPGRIEYLDNEQGFDSVEEYDEEPKSNLADYPEAKLVNPTSNPTVINVSLNQNRPGKPGTFSWGPITKADYEATEEHRRTNYGEFVRAEQATEKVMRTKRVEVAVVYEIPLYKPLTDFEDGDILSYSITDLGEI